MPRLKRNKDAIRFTVSLEPRLHAKLARIAESNDLPLSSATRSTVAEIVECQDTSHQAELSFSQPASKE